MLSVALSYKPGIDVKLVDYDESSDDVYVVKLVEHDVFSAQILTEKSV